MLTAQEHSSDQPGTQRLDEVMSLFAQYQRGLYHYVRAIVPSASDADEVLQETNIVVWRKFEQFQPGTDFRAWVFRIAFFEVRKLLDRRRRVGIGFSDEMLEQLTSTYSRHETMLEERRSQLQQCMEKLRPPDRELVRCVYGQGIDVAQLALQMGREQTSIYRSLRRIRQLLFQCIEGALRTEAI